MRLPKIILIASILTFLISCAGANTGNNITDYSEAMIAYDETVKCLDANEPPEPEIISVEETNDLPCGTRACTSSELVIYIIPEKMNVRVWKHEMGRIFGLWYYGDMRTPELFDSNDIFICNKER